MSWQTLWALVPLALLAWALTRAASRRGAVSGWGFPDEPEPPAG